MQIYSISPFFQFNRVKTVAFGIQKPTNTNTLTKNIIQKRKDLSPKKLELIEREKQVVALINSGMKQEDIAKKLNIHISMVNPCAKKHDAFQKRIQKRNKEIISRLINGESRKEIAKEYGLSVRTVEEIADKNETHKKYIEARDKKIMELLNKGYLAIEVATEMGISDSTVSRVAHKNGLFLKKKKSLLKKQ